MHVRAIGGGLVAYGLATWWVMGSGLIIAGVGAAIWSISTLAHANNASLYVRRWNYTKGANVSVSAVVFTEVGASVGWATPPGWVLLAAWDLYWLGDKLLDCCVGRRETLYESILSNEQGQSVSGNDGSASDERRVKLDHDQAGLAGDNGDDSE